MTMTAHELAILLLKLPRDTKLFIEAGDFAASNGRLMMHDDSTWGSDVPGCEALQYE